MTEDFWNTVPCLASLFSDKLIRSLLEHLYVSFQKWYTFLRKTCFSFYKMGFYAILVLLIWVRNVAQVLLLFKVNLTIWKAESVSLETFLESNLLLNVKAIYDSLSEAGQQLIWGNNHFRYDQGIIFGQPLAKWVLSQLFHLITFPWIWGFIPPPISGPSSSILLFSRLETEMGIHSNNRNHTIKS